MLLSQREVVQRCVNQVTRLLTTDHNPGEYNNYLLEGRPGMLVPKALIGLFPDSPTRTFYSCILFDGEYGSNQSEMKRLVAFYRLRTLQYRTNERIDSHQRRLYYRWIGLRRNEYKAVIIRRAMQSEMPVAFIIYFEDAETRETVSAIYHSSLMPTKIALAMLQEEVGRARIANN